MLGMDVTVSIYQSVRTMIEKYGLIFSLWYERTGI